MSDGITAAYRENRTWQRPSEKSVRSCPDCGAGLMVDMTSEWDSKQPFEVVCYTCGYFVPWRFSTLQAAEQYITGGRQER